MVAYWSETGRVQLLVYEADRASFPGDPVVLGGWMNSELRTVVP